jgi:tetratricopeptide (TPR) repeat protein
LAAASALLILGAGSWLVVVTIQDQKRQEAARAAAEKSSSASGSQASVAITTPLFVFPGKGESAGAFVALGEPGATVDRALLARARHSLLARELIRQALLIAARDELGLATRDAVLGDWWASDAQDQDAPAELLIQFQPGGSSRAWVRSKRRASGESLVECDLKNVVPPLREPVPDDLAKLVEIAESLSRNEFRAVLQKLGADGQANALRPDASVPDEVNERLLRLGYTESFQALRLLHLAMRHGGESPARLGALVRGYALLGILTEFHWHPAHAAFKARSFLYAQRLVARDPRRAWGYWHRAFAETLAGRHQDAIADLALAKSRAGIGDDSAPPEWAGLIEAAAHCDVEKLQSQRGPLAPQAAVLRLAIIETESAPSLLLQTAREVVAIDPECLRAIDAMCGIPTLKILDHATLLGPRLLNAALSRRLKSIADLPKGVAQQIGRSDGALSELADSLVAAGAHFADGGEPSWGVLGQLIRETAFVQVYRRLSFLTTFQPGPVDDYWSTARVAVARHRFGQVLESLVILGRERRSAGVTLDQEGSLTNLGVNELELLRSGAIRADSEKSIVRTAITSHLDHVACDLSRLLAEDNSASESERARRVRLLFAVSPHLPFARAKLSEADWDDAAQRAAEWQKQGRASPSLAAALARRAATHAQLDYVQRFLAHYIGLSPDAWAYEMLAEVYRSRGNDARWLATLEEFLNRGDGPGFDQARIQVRIAEYYMNRGEWAKASPYADKAGATWALWAMVCAQRCAEGMKDWKNAELWARRVSVQYPESSWQEWFLFCERTGQGEVKRAQAFAARHVAAMNGRAELANPQELGFFYWLSGDRKKALDSFRKAYESPRGMESGFYGLLVADTLGDTATRDELFKSFVRKHHRDAPRTIQIWELLRQAAGGPQRSGWDTKPIDQIISDLSDQNRWHMQFLVGEYLSAHGSRSQARAYLERCARSPHSSNRPRPKAEALGWPPRGGR